MVNKVISLWDKIYDGGEEDDGMNYDKEATTSLVKLTFDKKIMELRTLILEKQKQIYEIFEHMSYGQLEDFDKLAEAKMSIRDAQAVIEELTKLKAELFEV